MTLTATLPFAVGAVAALALVATLLVTIATDARFWPPGGETWKAVLHWGLVGTFDLALVAVAVLDWNAWVLPRPASLVAGATLALVGAAVFVHSERVMDADETTGRTADALYTDGPYARSRNPQYVGMLVGIVGFVLLANSLLVAVLAATNVLWVSLLPFAEEPWLRERFGAEYERYCDRVPRFVGRRTLRGE